MSRTGIFHILFTLFFSTLTILIFLVLILSSHLHLFKPFRLLTMFTDNQKARVLNPRHSRHNANTTTGDPFQTRRNTSSIVLGLGPRKDDRINHLLQDRRVHAVTCPQSWRGSPASLQLSQSPYSCPFFTLPLRCSPLKFFVPGASLLSLELPRLPQSFAVFPGVPQSSLELSSLCWSSSLSARVPATSLEPLSLGVLWRFFARLPLSSESFPVVSYDAAIAS